ncbi:hypothetical protein BCV70DRAFT_196701 [Testicularia cyperi]|uniref:Pre-rRNA-processing protein n=1 Tax=Testicularia cyperi TaxID=1882483 RepID=A0A317XX44_9BASI|nr:hypothetical protein BCV70DRAFT_196701 [Testicularia cyperi]
MPKATKRKKEKNADFQKTKLKLGKGKQTANNATDTSFKARTIALPQQSITSDKSGKLVTSRNLTLSDLAQQLRHYSANVRKEAVVGVREILTLHPVLITSAVGQILPDLSRCIGDDEGAVRKQLYSLLAWLLPLVPPQLLGPYHNTLLLFTTSALSHIYPEVRLDALRVLDICLELIPDVATVGWEKAVYKLVDAAKSTTSAAATGNASAAGPSTSASSSTSSHQQHGERIMNCYLNLLGITQRSSASSSASVTASDLAPQAKLVILKSLKTFLSHALPNHADDTVAHEEDSHHTGPVPLTCPTWFFRSSFPSLADFEYFQDLLSSASNSRTRHRRQFWSGKVDATDSSAAAGKKRASHETLPANSDFHSAEWGPGSLMDLDATVGKSVGVSDLFSSLQRAALPLTQARALSDPSTSSASASLALYTLLDPVLLATFLDMAPSAFQPDMDLSQQGRGQNAALSTPTQVISELISLILTLWRSSPHPSAASRSQLSTLLGHMSIYFPFSEQINSSALSMNARASIVQMDLAYAELTALLALNRQGVKTKTKFNLDTQITLVSAFIASLLSQPLAAQAGTVALASASGPASDAAVLDPETFRALLPTLWFLLGTKDSDSLLHSLLATYHAQPTSNKLKPILFEFLARICVLPHVNPRSSSTPIATSTTQKVHNSLLSSLPKSLWESANSPANHTFAGIILRFLHFFLLLPDAPTGLTLDRLCPFYWFKHPAKGTWTAGPFHRLPPRLHKLALDIASLLYGRDARLSAAIESARAALAA